MKIRFRQTGGWSAVTKECLLDTEAMQKPDVEALTSLVKTSGILETKGGRSPAARDAQVYELTVEDGPVVHRVAFDEATVPAEAEPLLDFLLQRSEICPPAQQRPEQSR